MFVINLIPWHLSYFIKCLFWTPIIHHFTHFTKLL